ncbi:cytochrome c biogenesis protein, transmembrane region, dsbD family [Gottschalkia acidurici 9a]|uniref:Cytochrome c biogenesis protein, transmembrane region, dsbD family n=1 Tax=Gottschalkia acidurici (strain ATCC 7906 / DSM 604 / BCRC 14475 / CIP 104303 / KCTC 5404 / NCIMB 10678 / 9a) TaxID=1128398 RepID=K0B123_GOTA9|nr:cytochrome c biogenesis protein CcdA [Gottschalkia acidurici]AFS79718.1 cytochrome c biogenesis protein, transmembrane region, dsbD family [Gottschalkia acidurici 9a]
MGLESVSTPIAFGAGFLSFFSPCILPLIPVYIMYLTGSNAQEELEKRRLFALTRTIGFIIGFTIIFMIMGTSASFLGKIFVRNKDVFSKVSGVIIIIFGLKMTGIINLNILNREKRIASPVKVTNWFSSVLMGIVFAAGWTPCFGPVLASILVYAGGTATVSKGVYLLLIYSLGMAVPFILTALFINIFDKFIKKAEKFTKYLPKISGIVMIIFGILVFFNKVINISGLLIR